MNLIEVDKERLEKEVQSKLQHISNVTDSMMTNKQNVHNTYDDWSKVVKHAVDMIVKKQRKIEALGTDMEKKMRAVDRVEKSMTVLASDINHTLYIDGNIHDLAKRMNRDVKFINEKIEEMDAIKGNWRP